MNKKTFLWIAVGIIASMLLAAGGVPAAVSQDGEPEPLSLARMEIAPARITWFPTIAYPYDSLILSIQGPDALVWEAEFAPQTLPSLEVADSQRAPRPDGLYAYTLRVQLLLSPEAGAALQAARETGDPQAIADLQAAGILPPAPYAQTGSFVIQNGVFLAQPAEAVSETGNRDGGDNNLDDIVYNENLIVIGDECVGSDCVNGEVFDYTTIKLKENNLGITFYDTSVGTFPGVDWQLTANESTSGGLNKFSIEDLTNAKIPFTILANAPSNAFYVNASGRVGMGTATPYVKLHLVNGNTPTVRLDQDTSSGWAAQVWDIAGNEQQFVIRDATHSAALPFRIQPGTPSNALTLRADGTVGIGTWGPLATLHVYNAAPTILVSRPDGKTTLSLDSSGNLMLGGLLTESSDINLKENLHPVDSGQILDLVAGLPIYTWNYREDEADTAHVGPMAQDFYAAFALGTDDKHIASLDANGVALASVQALHTQIKEQQTQIAQLAQQNADMEVRLARLEAPAGLGIPMMALYASLAVAVLALGMVAVLTWRLRARA
ncbi:MAG: tail fiber domain-containing protein [Anaerolineales bacterium]|nr:tail fiber domain-containing protein [Anaerolineales bacterium]MCB8983700.1 tail fiber domain-containing protein [Ardenticatenaceae bacterium]